MANAQRSVRAGNGPARIVRARPAGPAVARRRRTAEEARLEIIAIAREFLSTRGFSSLTVGALMDRTRIGRSAFYAYFKDIYELSEIFVHEIAEQIELATVDWSDQEGDPVTRVRTGLQRAVEFWRVNGRMIHALEHATSRDARLQRLWRSKFAMRPIRHVAEIIRRDQAAGLIGPMDADDISFALNRFNMTYLNDSFGTGRHRDVARVLETLERVWVGTLYGAVPVSVRREAAVKRRPRK